MYRYSTKKQNTSPWKKYGLAALIGVLPFLYFAITGYFDWADITVQDYNIGAFFTIYVNRLLTPL